MMENFCNYTLCIIVVLAFPLAIAAYIIRFCKYVKEENIVNEGLTSSGIFHQIVSNPSAQGQTAAAIKQNALIETPPAYEIKVDETISIDEFYQWLFQNGYINNYNSN